jgi:histidine triad (HIT) family protein
MRFLRVGCAVLAMTTGGVAAAHTGSAADVKPASIRCPLVAPYDRGNPFARMIRGEAPVSLIAQNDLVLAFVPRDWRNPGHALVVPRRAVRNLTDLTDAEVIAVARMVKRVAVAQERALGSTGFSVEQNNARNQEVCHAHFHVIPNTAPDAGPTSGAQHRSRAEMDHIAALLHAALPAD